ncbi:MAG: hypothetical protein OXN97_07950, partial [Bryobacterales bacterium]|nr:hypothetical protein [Bryobacterales bacterium]
WTSDHAISCGRALRSVIPQKRGLWRALTLLREQARLARWVGDRIARATLVGGAPPRVDFVAEQHECAHCGRTLSPHKSKTRLLVTLAGGTVLAREIRRHCSACRPRPVAVSRQLAGLAPPGQRFGYDLIVHVGLARHHRHLQREEIRSDLARQGVLLSTGSVSALCDRFLLALEALHWQRAPALRAAMPHGYPLHIDATCHLGRGGTFLCLAGWVGWVLHAVRITSENADELRPAVERTLDTFGDPLAVMRDLGAAGAKAVAACRQRDIPDLLCHFHFLAAVGHKLLDGHYGMLRNRISRSKVRGRLRTLLRQAHATENVRPDLPALLLWLLEGEGRKHLHFPFSLPHLDFRRRCERFPAQRDLRLPRPRTRVEQRMLRQAAEALADLPRTDPQARLSDRLERTWTVFRRLRSILRLEEDELPRGPRAAAPLPPAAAAARLQAIAADLQRYHEELRQRCKPGSSGARGGFQPERIVLRYPDRYGDGLTGHPVAHDEAGRALAVVDRTNNVLEQFFGAAKQGLRRRVGRAHLGRDLEDQPAQVALTANLRHADYVRILCGTLDQLPQAFAQLDGQPCTGPARLERTNRDAELRRRNRAWAQDAQPTPPRKPAKSSPKSPRTAAF